MAKDTNKAQPHPDKGVSRRDFLRGSAAAGALSSGLLANNVSEAGVAQEETTAGDLVGPNAIPISLRINGEHFTTNLEPRVTLLDALRNHLDLTGAKKVCDRATCGACTVLLDGKTVYACSVLAIEAQSQEITTIEGLGKPTTMTPLQTAFVENDAQQCGFCTPGFVISCKALLDRNPNPTVDEMHKELGGNLCRCGTYVGIRAAIRDVAKGGTANG